MILARVETTHYTFETIAADEPEAHSLMLQAWRVHCEQNPRADAAHMAELIDGGDMNVTEIYMRQVLRDGARIV